MLKTRKNSMRKRFQEGAKSNGLEIQESFACRIFKEDNSNHSINLATTNHKN